MIVSKDDFPYWPLYTLWIPVSLDRKLSKPKTVNTGGISGVPPAGRAAAQQGQRRAGLRITPPAVICRSVTGSCCSRQERTEIGVELAQLQQVLYDGPAVGGQLTAQLLHQLGVISLLLQLCTSAKWVQ